MSSSSPIEPTGGKWSDAIKQLVSTIYVMVPLGMLVYSFWTGGRPAPTVLLVVLVFMIASAYTVWGQKHVDNATDKLQEIRGEKESNDKEDEK